MVRQSISRELLDLSTAAIEGRLDDQLFARLEELTATSDTLCEQWLVLMQFHADMKSLAAVSVAEKKIAASLTPRVMSSHKVESSRSAKKNISRHPRTKYRLLVAGILALAASLLVGIAVLSWPGAEQGSIVQDNTLSGIPIPSHLISLIRSPRPIASLTAGTNPRWRFGKSFPIGRVFSEGDTLCLESGTAQISMVSGADIMLQSPCTIRLDNEGLVRLKKGKVTVQVAEWATGFVLKTQGLRVTDLGTRFAVSAEATDSAEVHVLEGSILVEPLHVKQRKNAKLLLVSGEAIRVGKRGTAIDRLVADRKQFVDKFDKFHPYRQIEIHNSGQDIAYGKDDPHWRITSGDFSSGLWPQQAVVNRPHPRYSDNAPENSQWISFPGGTTDGVLNYAKEGKIFTFETTFDLSGFDPATVNITAQILADNGVQEIRINGAPLDMKPWVHEGMYKTFCKFREVKIRDGFVDGINRLEIDIVNTPIVPRKKSQLNPMALRVEWQAFGRPHSSK